MEILIVNLYQSDTSKVEAYHLIITWIQTRNRENGKRVPHPPHQDSEQVVQLAATARYDDQTRIAHDPTSVSSLHTIMGIPNESGKGRR